MSEIVERFERIRRDEPARPLIHAAATGATLTAEDLSALAAAERSRLESLGIGSDHLVLSAAGNRPAAIALWLACRSLGAALMPLDVGTPAGEMDALAKRFGATAAIVADRGAGHDLGPAVPFVDGLVTVQIAGAAPAPHIYKGAAALKVTSGSTGLPKATFTTESQLLEDTLHITEAMDIRANDCQIAAIPLSHAYGLGNLLIPILVKGTAIVLREAFVPQAILADAVTFGARVFHGVPFMFAHFAANPGDRFWPATLETLVSAGAPLQRETAVTFAKTFGVKIHSFYGTTESGGISFDDSADPDVVGTVGRALPGVTITLKPEDGAPSGSGRVHVAGTAVASGYADATPADEGFTGGGFLTGDFGRYDAAGRLVLTGRASSFINVAGKKVQPEEVEQVLRSLPGIDDVRVIGAVDAVRGQQVLACVVARDATLTATAIRQYCAARLAGYKVPRTIIRLDRIPLTERGKTDRAKLEALVREHLDRTAESGVL
ncbi:MAG TPA: class I adenylate-forming enzyme family protein [Vicinamibacterales bacterium]|jgi:acyl-CoA synthetase (AMP-forming)/AMP-acid ligase II